MKEANRKRLHLWTHKSLGLCLKPSRYASEEVDPDGNYGLRIRMHKQIPQIVTDEPFWKVILIIEEAVSMERQGPCRKKLSIFSTQMNCKSKPNLMGKTYFNN